MSVSNKELIALFDKYEKVDKSVIHKNIYLLFDTYYQYKNQAGSKRIIIISGITNSAYNTVMVWNSSARPTKFPFMKLLQLADAFDIPVEYFLREDDAWMDEETRIRTREKIKELEGVYSD